MLYLKLSNDPQSISCDQAAKNGNVLPIKAFVPPILIMGFLMGLKGIQDKHIVA